MQRGGLVAVAAGGAALAVYITRFCYGRSKSDDVALPAGCEEWTARQLAEWLLVRGVSAEAVRCIENADFEARDLVLADGEALRSIGVAAAGDRLKLATAAADIQRTIASPTPSPKRPPATQALPLLKELLAAHVDLAESQSKGLEARMAALSRAIQRVRSVGAACRDLPPEAAEVLSDELQLARAAVHSHTEQLTAEARAPSPPSPQYTEPRSDSDDDDGQTDMWSRVVTRALKRTADGSPLAALELRYMLWALEELDRSAPLGLPPELCELARQLAAEVERLLEEPMVRPAPLLPGAAWRKTAAAEAELSCEEGPRDGLLAGDIDAAEMPAGERRCVVIAGAGLESERLSTALVTHALTGCGWTVDEVPADVEDISACLTEACDEAGWRDVPGAASDGPLHTIVFIARHTHLTGPAIPLSEGTVKLQWLTRRLPPQCSAVIVETADSLVVAAAEQGGDPEVLTLRLGPGRVTALLPWLGAGHFAPALAESLECAGVLSLLRRVQLLTAAAPGADGGEWTPSRRTISAFGGLSLSKGE